MASEIISGQQRGWRLVERLGAGDAGEVFRVQSVVDQRTAVMKRPQRSTFTGQVTRQAGQIEREGRVLRLLAGADLTSPFYQVAAPDLFDTSKLGTEFSERYFIILEAASGFDLLTLGRLAHQGPSALEGMTSSPREHAWLERIAHQGRLPEPFLLRLLAAVLDFLERIHSLRSQSSSGDTPGVLWNDVKPEHIFWEPRSGRITLIDWGNSQFLEADGASQDRQFSLLDDYLQYTDSFGRFLSEFQPSLAARLDWPTGILRKGLGGAGAGMLPTIIQPLRARIQDSLENALASLQESRLAEADLLLTGEPTLEDLDQLEILQSQIASAGELPDADGALELHKRLAQLLVNNNDLDGFRQVCTRATRLPDSQTAQWDWLCEVARQAQATPDPALAGVLLAGLEDDWATATWELTSLANKAQGDWHDQLEAARSLAVGNEVLPPLVSARRLLHTLQAARQKLAEPDEHPLTALFQRLKDEILPRWCQGDPDPPYSSLQYTDLEEFLAELAGLELVTEQDLARSLTQPLAQVTLALENWARFDIPATRRSLRFLLAWDPDRVRVFRADTLISAVPNWLERVRQGPRSGQLLEDFVTRFELQSRELRNAIGPASWLDGLLEAFSSLRRGASPVDVLLENPSLRELLPWMAVLAAQPISAEGPGKPVLLERLPYTLRPENLLQNQRDGRLGEDGDLVLGEALDGWVPEARGSSARVFAGYLRLPGDNLRATAVKLLRPERQEYALPLFKEEAQILSVLRDTPGVSGMLECGFVYPEDRASLPGEESGASARGFQGRLKRFGPGQVPDFLGNLDRETHAGGIPYLALEKQDRQDNLLLLCDAGYRRGRFLPIQETLRMAIQICDILRISHTRNIVYRDHKILHYYWLEELNGVQIIDWNIARLYPGGLSAAERSFDLVQFAARGLHHILTGRSAPGALPLGPNRPEEIEAAATSYRAQWTYDDNRLPSDVRSVIEKALAGGYNQAGDLKNDLFGCFRRLAALDPPAPPLQANPEAQAPRVE